GNGHVAHGDISVRDVSVRVSKIIERETDVVRAQLRRNGISIYQGLALFLDPHTLTVQDGADGHQVKAKNILIACGTHPAHSTDMQREFAFAELESGKKIQGDALVYAVGRQGNADHLHLEAAGLVADARGRVKVNELFQTAVPHIYAAGDVIGFPALASTSMEQGRLAACHMFGIPFEHMPELFPYGIYTIPEISMVGQTEETLTSNKVPYEVGIAR